MNWYSDIKESDLPVGKIRDIARLNGIFDAVSLLKNTPGIRIYIPIYCRNKLDKDYIDEHLKTDNILSVSVHLNLDTQKVKYLSNNKINYQKNQYLRNHYIELITEKCGKDVADRLINKFSGEFIYIPIRGFFELKRRLILKEFNGSNSADLAIKFEVTERTINKIVSDFHKPILQINFLEKLN